MNNEQVYYFFPIHAPNQWKYNLFNVVAKFIEKLLWKSLKPSTKILKMFFDRISLIFVIPKRMKTHENLYPYPLIGVNITPTFGYNLWLKDIYYWTVYIRCLIIINIFHTRETIYIFTETITVFLNNNIFWWHG